ncbi:MAG TPA: DUF1810 domain-containing protein [Acidimicrobiales bacterium]|nr:DUF1810 domain-containing protein [Acidimicrobiales bacterium]
MDDPYDLQRFLTAQDPVYDDVRAELRAGQKRTHWMWFVFPQLRGLGHSDMANRYGLESLDEASAYWAHPTLGGRLRECVELANAVEHKSALEIFDRPDHWKFRSCVTVFGRAVPDEPLFQDALDRFFGGEPDQKTIDLIDAQ